MFQTTSLSYAPEYLTAYLSPSTPVGLNACPRRHMSFPSDMSNYSNKRAVVNPLLQRKPSGEQHRRRQVFLEKVRQVSADKKWESRSEQVYDHFK